MRGCVYLELAGYEQYSRSGVIYLLFKYYGNGYPTLRSSITVNHVHELEAPRDYSNSYI